MIRITVDEQTVRVERKGKPYECLHEMVALGYILTKCFSDDIEIPMERAALELYQLIAGIIADSENELKEVK